MVGSTRFCVGDISNTRGNDNVTCTYANIGRVCENGKGVCKSGQNGAYCDTSSQSLNTKYYDCTAQENDTKNCTKNGVEGVCSYAPGDGYCKVHAITTPEDPTQGATAY